MPLILIPWIVGSLSAASAARGGVLLKGAAAKIGAARDHESRARQSYQAAQARCDSACEHARRRLHALGRTQARARRILDWAAEWLDASVRKYTGDCEVLHPEEVGEWQASTVGLGDLAGGLLHVGVAGLAAVNGMLAFVEAVGVASTGTAISSLYGAAAANATLAYLGGGAIAAGGYGMAVGTAILGGAATGPALLVAGCRLQSVAERITTETAQKVGEMEIGIARFQQREAELAPVLARSRELRRAIITVEHELIGALSSAQQGNLQHAFVIYKLARTLAELLDTRVAGDGR